MSPRTRTLPRDDTGCGWIALLPPPPLARPLVAEELADCVIVGAGFTGLAAARRLPAHRPQWRIVLLDAQRAGFGASGRNSGFLVDVGHYRPELGVEGNRCLVRLARAGIDEVRTLVAAHAIDCAWAERWQCPSAGHGAVHTRSNERRQPQRLQSPSRWSRAKSKPTRHGSCFPTQHGNLVDQCWHGSLPGIAPGQRYGYSVHGPGRPSAACAPANLVLDPYARAREGRRGCFSRWLIGQGVLQILLALCVPSARMSRVVVVRDRGAFAVLRGVRARIAFRDRRNRGSPHPARALLSSREGARCDTAGRAAEAGTWKRTRRTKR